MSFQSHTARRLACRTDTAAADLFSDTQADAESHSPDTTCAHYSPTCSSPNIGRDLSQSRVPAPAGFGDLEHVDSSVAGVMGVAAISFSIRYLRRVNFLTSGLIVPGLLVAALLAKQFRHVLMFVTHRQR